MNPKCGQMSAIQYLGRPRIKKYRRFNDSSSYNATLQVVAESDSAIVVPAGNARAISQV